MNIIISGASKGIGAEVVRQLDAAGHQCLALARNGALLADLKKECKQLKTATIDLNSGELAEVLMPIFEEWKKVDIIINNAGQLINKPFIRTSPSDFIDQFKANVLTAVNLIQAATPFLVKGSHIVNISSMGGINGSSKFPGLSAYSTSKGGLTTLSECLAEEYKEIGVQVNTLALGSVQTEMLQKAFPGYQASVSPKEMAEYIVDFSLRGNKYFNGKTLAVAIDTP